MRVLRCVLGAALSLVLLSNVPVQAQEAAISTETPDGTLGAQVFEGTQLDFTIPTTGTVFATYDVDARITSLLLNDSGGVLYIGYADGGVEARDTTNLEIRWQQEFFTGAIQVLARNGEEVLIVDLDGAAAIVSSATGELREDSPKNATTTKNATDAQLTPSQVILFTKTGEEVFDRRTGQSSFTAYSTRTVTKSIIDNPGGNGIPPTYRTITETVPVAPIAVQTMTVTAAPASGPGVFPWPAPRPSDSHIVNSYDMAAAGMTSFGDVQRHISATLSRAGALAPAHYVLSSDEDVHGFAMVTRVEEIRQDGTPVRIAQQSVENESAGFSLGGLLRRFISAPAGFYRVIAFVLTDDTSVGEKRAVSRAEAEGWLQGNVLTLPPTIAARQIENHFLTILIYQFEKSNKQQPAILTFNPQASALTHLANSRLSDAAPPISVQP